MRYFILFLVFFIANAVFAGEIYPVYVNPSLHFGQGIVSITKEIKVYKQADEKSPVIAILDKNGIKGAGADEAFIVSKKDGLRLLAVENDNDEWYLIYYNQTKGLTGWIKKSEDIDYMNLEQFFNFFGRKNGIYIFRNLPNSKKKLYSAPNEDSTVVDSFNFSKHAALWLISGDWMLIKVTTYDGITKTGWLRFRLENGNLAAFPDFSE